MPARNVPLAECFNASKENGYDEDSSGVLDCWMRGETAREVIVRGKARIDAAAHDGEGLNL